MSIQFKSIGTIFTPYLEKAPFRPLEEADGYFHITLFDEYLDCYCEVITDFAEMSDKLASKLEKRQ